MTELLNRDSLLEFLQSHPGEHTNTEIAEAFGLPPTRLECNKINEKLNALRKWGAVVPRYVGMKGFWRAI